LPIILSTTMRPLHPPLPISLLLALAPLAAAQETRDSPAAPVEQLPADLAESLLGQLEQIEQSVKSSTLDLQLTAVEAFRKAAASPESAYQFFLDCHQELNFTRKGLRVADFRTWRDRNESRYKSPSHMAALQAQLRYLILSIRASSPDTKRAEIVPELATFLNGLVASPTIIREAGDTLRQPVNSTIFAELYGIDQKLSPPNWHLAPLDVDAVYQKTILPFYKAEDPSKVAAAWDARIALRTEIARAAHGDAAASGDARAQEQLDRFKDQSLPSLRWSRAQDLFELGYASTSLQEMLAIIKANPQHPSVPDWIDLLKELLLFSRNNAS